MLQISNNVKHIFLFFIRKYYHRNGTAITRHPVLEIMRLYVLNDPLRWWNNHKRLNSPRLISWM